ncbi:hypothetical protein SSS_07620 [Sarcoptes scabiei]|uniref:Uncharacterized protein n=1 Tax=Sarcoptes scabiei TaxID=52283 RepID=A0A834R6W0_SARSC|nr:hypothetical protein SSS_07620 [Sarcoptes scabiei]
MNAFDAFHHSSLPLHQIWISIHQILIADCLPDENHPTIVLLPNWTVVGASPARTGGGNLRDGRRTQSRVQEISKNLLGFKTATGILMIELHHLGGGLPDPDRIHHLAGIKTEVGTKQAKMMSHQHRLYRFAKIYPSRIFEKLHHHQIGNGEESYHYRIGITEEQHHQSCEFSAAQNHQQRTGKMAAMAATYRYRTCDIGAKQTRGGAVVQTAIEFNFKSKSYESLKSQNEKPESNSFESDDLSLAELS